MNLKESEFRGHLSNVDSLGNRIWIYPKIIKGWFYKQRTYVSWVMLVFLFLAPHLHWKGHSMFLFDVINRKFILFGVPFWPQDLHLFALALLTFIVFIILFTSIFGRFFCGWACPQTIFMEMVFRKIEQMIEGNERAQKKLNALPWNKEKVLKKALKHAIFWLISFAISNTFLMYIIGSKEWYKIIIEPVSDHIGGLISIIVFTTVFYLVFAKLRELVCIMICPYGRLQGVLLDNNSLVVAYDYKRGEPRGKINKNEERKEGDCVECNLCVDVCPTGIDIRNGTQLECIHCTACIDACDSVMNKIKKPNGLIRYASENGIATGKKFRITPRIIGYTCFFILLSGVLITALIFRKPVQAEILRQKGTTYIEEKNGKITNVFDLRLINKHFDPAHISIKLKDKQTELKILTDSLQIDAGQQRSITLLVRKEAKRINHHTTPLTFEIYSRNEKVNEVNTKFLAPVYQ